MNAEDTTPQRDTHGNSAMKHDLLDLLDLVTSRETKKDRLEVVQLARENSNKDTYMFSFKIKEIHSTYSYTGNDKYRGGTTIIGELVDERRKDKVEYLHDQNGQQIELMLPKRWNKSVSEWKAGEEIFCSGSKLHDWDEAHDRYQLLATSMPGLLSLPVIILCWAIKILIWWPIWIPCWLIYKLVYIAIPVGLVVWAVATKMGDGKLAHDAIMLLVFVTPVGLTLRFYIWAITLRDRMEGHE